MGRRGDAGDRSLATIVPTWKRAQPPAFAGISIDGRRIVNTAVIAYAQQLVASLSTGGLAMLAKETTSKRLYDVRYGGREECARLMALLREALAVVKDENEDLERV